AVVVVHAEPVAGMDAGPGRETDHGAVVVPAEVQLRVGDGRKVAAFLVNLACLVVSNLDGRSGAPQDVYKAGLFHGDVVHPHLSGLPLRDADAEVDPAGVPTVEMPDKLTPAHGRGEVRLHVGE